MTGNSENQSRFCGSITGRMAFLFLAAALLTVLVALIFSRHSNMGRLSDGGKASFFPLTVGINNSLKSAPLVIADKIGGFTQQGLAVTLSRASTSALLLERMLAGKLDVVCVPEQLIAFLAMERSDFRVLAVLNRNQSQELIINTDKKVYSPFGLKGRRIGLDMDSAAPYFLYRKLLFYNITLGDVELIDLKPNMIPDKMAAGEIDAAIVWPPYSSRIRRQLGTRAVFSNAHLGRDMYWLLVARDDWCRDHEQVLEYFFVALETAFVFMKDFPGKAMSMAGEYFDSPSHRVSEEWGLYHFDLELPQSLLFALEQEARWWREWHQANGRLPDFFLLVESRPLKNTFPDKVTIIQ